MSNEKDIPNEGKYIYGIIRHGGPLDLGPIGIGKRGDHVLGISYRDICAVVSKSPVIQYEARRVHMMAHQKVLEEVMKNYTILPVRFSTISEHDGDDMIRKILEKDYDIFDDALKKMEGKKELGIKSIAQESEFYKNILEKYDEIRSLRDKLIGLPHDKTYYQRMKIGEMVAEALEKEIENYKRTILSALEPLANEVKINDNYGNMMILNAAFLVKKTNEPAFDRAVDELDEKYGHFITFKYVTDLPPYNFVNLTINTKEI